MLCLKVSSVQDAQVQLDFPWLGTKMIKYWQNSNPKITSLQMIVSAAFKCHVQLFQQLEVSILEFQKFDKWTLHLIHSTAGRQFQNSCPQENWAWIQTGSKKNYGFLHCHLCDKTRLGLGLSLGLSLDSKLGSWSKQVLGS